MHSGLQSPATASSETARHCGLIIWHIGWYRWEGTRLGRPPLVLLGRLGTGGAQGTVEP